MTGATIRPNLTLAEALVNVRLQVTGGQGKACSVLYFGDIDSVGHVHGPEAPQMEAEIDAFLTIVERWLRREIDGKVQDTLLMLFADHGQVGIDPKTTIYLNRARIFPQLEPLLRTDRGGRIIAPAGGPRDFFLHVRDESVDEAQTLLGSFLAGRAEVAQTEALIDAGYFGPGPVADVFRRRVGNLVVLPYAGESVCWYEKDRFEQKFYGHHGGLTLGGDGDSAGPGGGVKRAGWANVPGTFCSFAPDLVGRAGDGGGQLSVRWAAVFPRAVRPAGMTAGIPRPRHLVQDQVSAELRCRGRFAERRSSRCAHDLIVKPPTSAGWPKSPTSSQDALRLGIDPAGVSAFLGF